MVNPYKIITQKHEDKFSTWEMNPTQNVCCKRLPCVSMIKEVCLNSFSS